MNHRIERDNLNIIIALAIAERSTCQRGKVGCIITLDNRIISTGFNGSAKGVDHCESLGCDLNSKCVHSIHAEQNAICFAAKKGIPLMGSTLYSTTSPCYNCAKLIYQSGIIRVVYLREYEDKSGINFLFTQGVHTTKIEDEQVKDNLQRIRI